MRTRTWIASSLLALVCLVVAQRHVQKQPRVTTPDELRGSTEGMTGTMWPLFLSDAVTVVAEYPHDLGPVTTPGSSGTPGPYPPQPVGATQGIVFNFLERYPDNATPWGYRQNSIDYGAYGLDYNIRDMAARHAQEIYTAGVRDADGKTVIEKWFFLGEPGGGIMTRGAVNTIGQPVDPTTAFIDLVTDTYVDPQDRPRYHPIRTTVFQGILGSGGVGALAVDPERRFVLVLSAGNPRQLWQVVNLGPNAVAQLLYDESSLPDLAGVDFISVHYHSSDGRVYYLRPHPMNDVTAKRHILIVDPENDGILDAPPRVFTDSQWESSAYGGSSNPWEHDYLYDDFYDEL